MKIKRISSSVATRLAATRCLIRQCELNGDRPGQSRNAAFSLIEVALAVSLTSFVVVSLLGLLPIALHNFQQADNQSAMVNLATSVAQDLNSTATTQGTNGVSPRYSFSVPPSGGSSVTSTNYVDASGAPANVASATYRVTVVCAPPALGTTTATPARITITFPAQATTSYTSIFQTSVSLNRN